MKYPLVLLAALISAPATALPAEGGRSLLPPDHVGPPRPDHAATNRAFQGIPSLAVAPGGRLWAVWYAGVTPAEDQNNYVVLAGSGDGGRSWDDVLAIDPDGGGPVRAFDPEVWPAPDGRLYVFWAQMDTSRRDAQLGVWCIETDDPGNADPAWSAPRRIGDGVMMCKPLVLSSGEWVLPISTWREHDHSAQMVVSDDGGKTWTVRGACNVPVADRQFDEHMFIERRDGSLWLLARTKYGIGQSVSTDRGRTWPELEPSSIPHPSARFFIRRLDSGSLLLVKHGPLNERTGRSHLTAYVSTDDGRTWGGGLIIDERPGVSYPDGQQTPDGLIRIIYDYNRVSDRNILVATFREKDAAAGRDVSGQVRLCQLVSKASGGREKPKAAPRANADGRPLRTDRPGALGHPGAAAQVLAPGARLFTDRRYRAAELPEALKAARFVPVAMDGEKTLTCARAGTVWFLTPAPERNRDSQSKALLDQGFEKAALAEVPLFNPESTANYCTLYQKDCRSGETIVVGKWALPVFPP